MPPVPEHMRPMMAQAGALPADDEAWAFEPKWDGIRAVALFDGTRLRFQTRSLRDVTVAWPELHPLAEALTPVGPVVLDGEIVAFDEDGRPSFGCLQERMHVANDTLARQRATTVPATYLLFDVVHLDGHALFDHSWSERRARLDALALAGSSWATPACFIGEGEATLAASRRLGMEGVIAKRVESRYTPGQRSRDWVKVKFVHRDEFVVGGWAGGAGARAGHIGALLLGRPTSGRGLDYVGSVGTGFTAAELVRLKARLTPLIQTTSPFTTTVPSASAFVDPIVVVDVEYTEVTSAGRLRHPSYKGERVDKSVDDVNTDG